MDPEANSKRIENVEKCFFGSLTQPLNIPDRILVGEGVLTKMCRKKPKPRQFFLFDDILVYGTIVMARKKYNSMHVIDLADVKLMSIEDDLNLRNGWQIISPKKSFTVYAATAQEKMEWMAHINRCVQELVSKRGINKDPQDDSPVWIPDSEANKCMVCNKAEFTVLNRKHHCRKCGRVVCNPCSLKRWLLPSQSTKPQRVCDRCYDRLSQTGDNVPTTAFETLAGEETSDSSSDEGEVEPMSPNTAKNVAIAISTTTSESNTEPKFYERDSVTSAEITNAGGADEQNSHEVPSSGITDDKSTPADGSESITAEN